MFDNVLLGLIKKTKENGGVSVYISLNVELIRKGILQDLTGNEVKVLLAIASYMDEEGECTPVQERIATMTNLASSTVSLAVNSIIRKKIDGRVLMKRKFVGKGSKKYSKYKFPLLGDVETESDIEERLTAPAVLKLFQAKYEEIYKIPYKPNYRRDCSMIKKTLLATYEDEQIKKIISVAVEEYDKRWKNSKYPSITVGALCSWIAQEALKIVRDREKKVTDRDAKYAGLEDDED